MARYTTADRQFEQEFKKSLSVSSYYDQIIDKITDNKDIQPGMVPNLAPGSSAAGTNESQSLYHLDNDTIFKAAASSMGNPIGATGLSTVLKNTTTNLAPQDTPQNVSPAKPKFKISRNQYMAIQKYPALVEFLGSEGGASLVKDIAAKVNGFMVAKISKNTKEISKFAQVCVADKQNIKQYFAGENKEWICIVTASGPFRGDEAFLYKKDTDQAYVLRKVDNDYEDVTAHFNMIHNFQEEKHD